MKFNVKGFLFDMDGTLVDSTAVVESIWTAFCVRRGLDARALIAYSHGRQTLDTLQHFLGDDANNQAIAAELERIEIETLQGITEVKGAAALLAALPADRWALVTSAGRTLAESRMKAARLPLPAVMICAEDVQRGKPDPEGYNKAAAALGLKPEACVVFEDAAAGIRAGLASGATVIAVVPGAAGAADAHAVSALSGISVTACGDGFTVSCEEACADRRGTDTQG